MADKTVYVDGTTSSGHYATLAAAITGEVSANANLVTMAGILNIEISITSAETTAVDVTGFTTSSSYYVNIYTTAGARHDGKWNSSKYRIEVSGSVNPALKLSNYHTRVTGLQVKATTTAAYQYCIPVQCYIAPGCQITSSIMWCLTNNNNTYLAGVYIAYYDTKITNCVIFKTGTGTHEYPYGQGILGDTATATIYNTTVHGFNVNYYLPSGSSGVLKNCISQASGTTGYSINTSTGSDYNLSDRADAVGTTVYNSKTLTFVNAAAGDFHLASGDTDAIDTGTSLSGTFTDDIDGVTRSGTWDLGADEYVAAGSTFVPQVIMVL